MISNIDHIVLYLILLFVLYIYSNNITQTIKKVFFILSTLFVTIVYAWIEGHRYGRGIDWFSYRGRYYVFDYLQEMDQPLFCLVFKLCRFFQFDFTIVCSLFAGIFLLVLFAFIRNTFEVRISKWMYLLALYPMLWHMENLMREFLAYPLILFSLHTIVEKRWVESTILILIAFFIHSGSVFILPFFILFYFIYTKEIPFTVSFLSLLFIYLFPLGELLSYFFIEIAQFFVNKGLVPEQFVHFIVFSDRWLGIDSILEENQKGVLTQILQFLFESSVLFLGYKALLNKPNRLINCFYSITLLGFLLCRVFYGYELMERIFNQLYFLWFVPAGYSLAVLSKNKKYVLVKDEKKLKYSCIIFLSKVMMVMFPLMKLLQFIFFNPTARFVWNV